MKRLFLVGCPRSGTTLLQSMLASHDQIISFPETHLFSKTIPIQPLLQTLKVYHRQEIQRLNSLLESLNIEPESIQLPETPIFKTGHWVKELLPVLDQIAVHFGSSSSSCLLEKTPRHLHFVDIIHDVDPEAEFIHIIRKGEDVVASLSEATSDHPGKWEGSRSLKKSVFWWNRSIRLSSRYLNRKKHHFVLYRDLIDAPSRTLQKLMNNLKIEFHPDLVTQYHETAEDLILDEEKWKAKNTTEDLSRSVKFQKLTTDEQKFVSSRLVHFDYESISVK